MDGPGPENTDNAVSLLKPGKTVFHNLNIGHLLTVMKSDGGSAVGGRSNHGRLTITTPFFYRAVQGRLEKSQEAAERQPRGERSEKKTSPHRERGLRLSTTHLSIDTTAGEVKYCNHYIRCEI
eukprot:scaffold191094_cov66-Cyclotella_meneghiniana.AAC.1